MKSGRKQLAEILSKNIICDKEIAVFGAGNTASLYEPCFVTEGIRPVYFIDNNKEKKGKKLQDIPIIDYEDAKSKCKNMMILICAGHPDAIGAMRKQLEEDPIEGVSVITVDEYVFRKNAEKVKEVIDQLDEDSKEIYEEMLLARMGYFELDDVPISKDMYFALNKFRVMDKNEVFVDCGAFVGDTVEQYIETKMATFKTIYAFEPDDKNYTALKNRTERLEKEWAVDHDRIIIEKAGIGRKTTKLPINKGYNEGTASLGSSFMSSIDGDEEYVQLYSLDEYFSEKKIGFLKADIESYEWELLLGAEKTIKRDKPLITICIYHNPSDMFRIMLKIKEYCSDYRFAIKQHYYGLSDTVLYAYR